MFRYIPSHLLDDRAHVIVDGAPRRGTQYTLSHWPGTPTPPGLRADLSAEIARHALDHPELRPGGADVASIDHYDVDGVVALALLVVDGLNAAHGPRLVEAARVGDFDVVTDRWAALVAFALNGLYDGHGGGGAAIASGAHGAGDALERCGRAAEAALAVMGDLADDPGRFEALWRDEWAAYDASVRAFEQGWATIEELPEFDLAVVRVDRDHDGAAAAAWQSAPVHRAAVHSATTCLRVATLTGDRMELRYRYESWVRLTGRRPRARVDLERLAAELTAAEEGNRRWVFDGAGATRGALHLARESDTSTIAPARFVELVCERLDALDRGPAAWDPYRAPPG
jgi:hypothetical protein